MAGENTVKYEINVTKTGEGATQAVNDFKAVEAAVAKTNATVSQNTNAVNQNAQSNAAANKQFSAFKGTLTLVAGQAFPQLTASVMVAKNAVDSMRASNSQMQVGFATTAAAVVGLAGIVVSAAAAWAQYAAEKQQAASASNLSWQESEIQKSLMAEIDALEKRKELTKDDARRLRNATGDSGGNRSVQDFIRYRTEPNARDILSGIARTHAEGDSVRALENPIDLSTAAGKDEARTVANDRYIEQLDTINQLEKEGAMTKAEADAAAQESAINYNTQMLQLHHTLTDIQMLGRDISQTFAGGLANAFVSFVDGTKSAKEAFTDFARNFLSSVAQMILQMLILKSIKGVFGSALGFAEGGMSFAASGGMFPRYAANGLSGVSSVSSPTYFPRFNVVAGEAGREMLTVLARPRMMEVGGMQAVVGSAQGNRLAITSADALAKGGGGGAGGTIVVQVQGTPDFEARVVANSVKGAQVQVANDMRQDTAISRGVKGLTA